MKVLVVSIDGVLNSKQFFLTADTEDRSAFASGMLDPKAVRRLNVILHLTKAKVLVSSVWRFSQSFDQLRVKLDSLGFSGEILGATPHVPRVPGRCGVEIQKWLDSYAGEDPVEALAILSEGADVGAFKDRLVRTTFEVGLQDEHVSRVVALLGSDL